MVAPFVLPKHETFFFVFFFPSSKCGAFLKPSSLWINPGERTFRALIILGHFASFSSFHLFELSQTLPVPSYNFFHFIPFDLPHHSSFRASLVKYILKVKKWVNIWNPRLHGDTDPSLQSPLIHWKWTRAEHNYSSKSARQLWFLDFFLVDERR